MLRVDYHLHTSYSYDSEASLDEILMRAKAARLDRLCVTDHDTIEGALRLREMAGTDLEVVVGCEFSTDDGSQIIGLYLSRLLPQRGTRDLLEAIRSDGGQVLLPHPFRRSSGIFRPEMKRTPAYVDEVLSHTDLVESFNGHDTFDKNAANLEFARARSLPAVAGSDAHRAAEIGSVFIEYEGADAIDGKSRRRFYFPTQDPRREPAVKRRVLELYHRHQTHLPGPVRSLYDASRRRYAGGRTRATRPTEPQYDLPLGGDSGNAP